MSEVLLHYCGLSPGQHTWYYNKRGAFVHVYPGEWVRLDLDRHPEVQHSIATGVAVAKDLAPPGSEILDENTYSGGRYRFPERIKPETLQGLRRSSGHPKVARLSDRQIEMIAQRFVWLEEPAAIGLAYVKDYPRRRGPKPEIPRLAPTIHPMFAKNFAVLCRLAELLARKARPDPGPGSGWRARRRIRDTLKRWKVWDKEDAPSSATLHRYRSWLGLTRRELDLKILSDFPVKCAKCNCPTATSSGHDAPCHRWDNEVACPHCGTELLPPSTRVLFL